MSKKVWQDLSILSVCLCIQESFKSLSRDFHKTSKSTPRVFLEFLQSLSKNFQESFWNYSRVFEVSFLSFEACVFPDYIFTMSFQNLWRIIQEFIEVFLLLITSNLQTPWSYFFCMRMMHNNWLILVFSPASLAYGRVNQMSEAGGGNVESKTR